jgi:hypothetical protein
VPGEQSGDQGLEGSGSKRDELPGRQRREPSESKPDSASLHSPMVTNLPKMAKSETRKEAGSTCTCGTIRGDWGGRAPKDRSWYPGDPMLCSISVRAVRAGASGPQVAACGERGEDECAQAPRLEPADVGQRRWGIHNPYDGGSRESEQPIAAEKRGNARGAKGLYFSHVYTKVGRPD